MVKIAVVGAGYWGPNLIRNFANAKDAELSMVCDMDPKPLAWVTENYPQVRTTTSFQDVLESADVDAVVLATPVRTHYALGKQALLRDKHLMVEKPLASTSQECEELADLAAQRGRVLLVGHTFLYHPSLLKVKELLDGGELGDLLYLYSQRLNLGRVQTDVNAMWSIAPHDISIATFLAGGDPAEVSARGAAYLTPGVQDVVFMDLTFANGVMAHIQVSWLDPTKTRKLTVVGSERMLIYDDVAPKDQVTVYDKGAVPDGLVHADGRTRYTLKNGAAAVVPVSMSEPLANECTHFVECIRDGRTPRTDGRNGLQVVRIMEAVQRSLDSNGAPVRLQRQTLAA